MIGYLKGTLLEKEATGNLLLDVAGVGYAVLVAPRLVESFQQNSAVELFIYTHFQENALSLFGFESKKHKELFLTLIKVSGIGPRLALSLLSQLKAADLAQAISDQDQKRLSSLSGIGKKTAERIVLELKDKMLPFLELTQTESKNLSADAKLDFTSFLSAMRNFGYTENQIQRVWQSIQNKTQKNLEAIIKEALKLMAS